MTTSASRLTVMLSIVACCAASPAWSKPARCFTTDDGYFPCSFVATDGDGSFEISAKGYPTYTISVDQPGFAYGFLDLGNRNVSLPGQFLRQNDDPACW